MITMLFRRFDGPYEDPAVGPTELTLGQAYRKVVDLELEYWSSVILLTPTMIVFTNTVLNKRDENSYSGPQHEMEVLLRLVACYLETAPDDKRRRLMFLVERVRYLRDMGLNPPPHVKDYVLRNGQTQIAMAVAALGVFPDPQLLIHHQPSDLIAAALLQHETGTPIREVLEILSG